MNLKNPGLETPTARPIAVYVLDQHVFGRVLDGDAFVSVRNL